MQLTDLKDRAPVVLLLLASVILAIMFYLPVGVERRRSQTKYKSLEGFSGLFQVHQDSAPIHVESRPAPTVVQSAAPNHVSQTDGLKPVVAAGKMRRARTQRRLKDAPAAFPRHSATDSALRQQAPAVVVSTLSAPSSVVAEKAPGSIAPTPSRPVTFDSVAEDYDNDAAKYPMERSVVQGPIALGLCGLSRSKNPVILKVAVTNQGGEDFFIKELTMRDAQRHLEAHFYVRLFVEPGRTREAYITFERPHAGADVHVALKEDRENGRVVELAVPYSF